MTEFSRRRRPRSLVESLRQHKFLFLNIATSGILAVLAAVWLLHRSTDDGDDDRAHQNHRNADRKVARKTEAFDPKKPRPGLCRVYTKQPGCYVFVDGEPARERDGNWIKTPCAVTVPRGGRDVTVARPGFRDRSQYVDVDEETDVVFNTLETARDGDAGLLDAAYLKQQTGVPIPLFRLNTERRELDPFITPDGRTLYFASDRSADGRSAVYEVSRKSAYHYFSAQPEPIEKTSGPRMPAAPAVTADGLSLVYTIPELGVVKCITRASPVGEFDRKTDLDFERPSGSFWLAAQIIRDGNRAWRFYGLLRNRGRLRGYTGVARQRGEREDPFADAGTKTLLSLGASRQQFGRLEDFDLRETPPCFSRDGLRQYFFDGKTLRRAIRPHLEAAFSEPRLLASFDRIGNYAPARGRRSFSVTDDEQWLVYESNADLHLVRVFNRPRRELLVLGRTIPPRAVGVVKNPPVESPPKKGPTTSIPKVDPRTQPLPYPVFRRTLVELLRARNYEDARRHVAAGLKNPKLANDRDLVQWDARDVDNAAGFWNDFDNAAAKMRPGDEFSASSVRLSFQRYNDGELVATVAGRTVRKKSRSLKLTDAVRIVDAKTGRDDPQVQTRLSTFWFYDAEGSAASAFGRFRRAPNAGRQFRDRLAERRLRHARQEFARKNVAAALEIVASLRESYPRTTAAALAKALVERAYAAVKWDAVGPRVWKIADGAYTATKEGRKAGSLLRSPRKYENFELRLEWKSDVPNGQGGVYFRCPGIGNPIDTAFKIQLSDDFNGPVDRLCTGSLFKRQAPTGNPVKRQGTWNELRLRVREESVLVVINGRTVLDSKADSKTIPLAGYVALDGVLGGITYRKTLLMELPANSSP